ncbi:hypothetical protein AB3K25_03405 [Leuconostoc sp. MS02]|uniref:AAA+ ATPase domain-containing protein n=1 Tax=Leuconostoc aquikimchii TaxID=3236804 RepID=A0ABV3S3L1_9LACO
MLNNPFNPTFDYNRDSFINDDYISQEIITATRNISSKWHTTLITGMRGAGKTSLLTHVSLELKKQPHIVTVSVTSTPDLLNDVLLGVQDRVKQSPKIKGLSIKLPLLSADIDVAPQAIAKTFKYDLEKILDYLNSQNMALVVLLDEVQNNTPHLDKLLDAFKSYRQLPAILIAAGLPSAIDTIMNGKASTYLLRANRVELMPLDVDVVRDSYLEKFKANQLSLADAEQMAKATGGYPYMYQLMGDYVWRHVDEVVTSQDIKDAFIISQRLLFSNVYEKVLADLEPKDRELIIAIHEAGDFDVSTQALKDILGWNINVLSTYKAKLNKWRVTQKPQRGLISLALPYFSQFLDDYYD